MAYPPSCNDESSDRLSDHAFAACYEQYASGVRAFLRAKLSNEADADDCFSRVIEKLWSRGGSVVPAALGAWLFVVARREAALHWRSKSRAEGVWNALASEYQDPVDERQPEENLLRIEGLELLRLAAEQLPSEQKEVLRRRFVDNSSFREIAQELNLPIGTALSRMHTALKRLRKILNDDIENRER